MGDAVNVALLDLWADVIGIIPELISALVLFIIGLIFASALGKVVTRFAQFLKVDTMTEKFGVTDQLKAIGLSFSFSNIIGKVVKYFFVIVFLIASVELLGMSQITLFLNDVLGYLPNVVVAIIIMAIGLVVGQFVRKAASKMLEATKLPVRSPEMFGSIAMWVVVVFASMAALIQLGIAAEMIQILFTAIVFAFALAFGLGGKDHAARALNAMFAKHD